jgi:protein SCO1
VIVAVAALSACGSDGYDYHGVQRDDPLQVGAQVLPEVTTASPTPFPFRAAPGTLLAVYFGYTTCPDLCPTTMTDLRDAKRELGEDGSRLRVAFASVDPERDTEEGIGQYLGSFFPAGEYHALRTEDRAELQTVLDAFLASYTIEEHEPGALDYGVSHTGTTYVVDENGTVLLEWPFGVKGPEMADDVSALLKTT